MTAEPDTGPLASRVAERWRDIKARSESNGVCCESCYFSFFHGLQHPDGGGYPCPVHATEEERREVDKRISESLANVNLDDHPLMQLVRRSKR